MAITVPGAETIVYLDSCWHIIEPFPAPHTYTSYSLTPIPLIPSRSRPASILITSLAPLTASTLSQCANLKLVIIMGVGTNHVDLLACQKLGICVSNIPDANTETVAEHAIALYFAVKRDIVQMHQWTMDGGWGVEPSVTRVVNGCARLCGKEILGIVGCGKIGMAIAEIGRSLGMRTLLSDRKPNAGSPPDTPRPERTPFSTVLQESTILILCCPLTPSTHNLITSSELKVMRPDAILINVARGSVVNETDLVRALDTKQILGAATDVFATEPATNENSVLLREGRRNLIVSPHVAWYGKDSEERCRVAVKEIVEGWERGWRVNVVV